MLDLSKLDDGHLRALALALYEARFCEELDDPRVWTSPLVVDLHEWALNEQRARDDGNGDATWDAWLTWSGRPEADTVARRLRNDGVLLAMVEEDPEVLRSMLRPFEVTDADLESLLDAARRER